MCRARDISEIIKISTKMLGDCANIHSSPMHIKIPKTVLSGIFQ